MKSINKNFNINIAELAKKPRQIPLMRDMIYGKIILKLTTR